MKDALHWSAALLLNNINDLQLMQIISVKNNISEKNFVFLNTSFKKMLLVDPDLYKKNLNFFYDLISISGFYSCANIFYSLRSLFAERAFYL